MCLLPIAIVLLIISSFVVVHSQRLLITLMAARQQAADEEEVAFYNEQIDDVKETLKIAKEMQVAVSQSAARLETRAAMTDATTTATSSELSFFSH